MARFTRLAALLVLFGNLGSAQQLPSNSGLSPVVARQQAVAILHQAQQPASSGIFWAVRFRLAVQLSRAGEHDAAMAELREAIAGTSAARPSPALSVMTAVENQWPIDDRDGVRYCLEQVIQLAGRDTADRFHDAVIQKAAALARRIGDEGKASEWLSLVPPQSGHYADVAADLAAIRVKAGDMAGARQLASGKPDAAASAILRGIAKAQVDAGDFAGAEKTADSMPHLLVRAQTFAQIAEARAHAGDRDGAAADFSRALAIANQDWDGAKYWIATAEARAGDFASAAQVILSERNNDKKEQAVELTQIAAVAADAGKKDAARDIAGLALSLATALPESLRESFPFSPIAEVQAEIGDDTAAKATAALLAPGGSEVLLQISQKQAERGDVVAAELTLADTPYRDRPQQYLADAKARKGDFKGALEAAANVINFRTDVLREMAKGGDLTDALNIANLPEKPAMKADLLIATAQGLLDAAEAAESKAKSSSETKSH